jgi:hypothetical protein
MTRRYLRCTKRSGSGQTRDRRDRRDRRDHQGRPCAHLPCPEDVTQEAEAEAVESVLILIRRRGVAAFKTR